MPDYSARSKNVEVDVTLDPAGELTLFSAFVRRPLSKAQTRAIADAIAKAVQQLLDADLVS